MYDAVVIGAGVVGSLTARKLTEQGLKVCVLEKENDVAMGATKANSAIVHAGFDAKEGSLKALLNVRGSKMMQTLCAQLGVKYENNGSLVVGFSEQDRGVLLELLIRGMENGVEGLKIVEGNELFELEPNLSPDVKYALHAPTGAIVCPYELTVAALGNAMDNGAKLLCNFEVTSIDTVDSVYVISDGTRSVEAEIVINAAGLYSDKIAAMIGDNSFSIHPRRGEYILLDKSSTPVVKHTVFRTPSKMGKGILVSPTVDGNTLLGPTSVDIEDKSDNSTTREGFDKIISQARENVASVPLNKSITSFCGLRAVGSTGDFIITSPRKGFINLAGIESPGLSASPAIAEYVADILLDMGYNLRKRDDFNPLREPMHGFREMNINEKNEIIKKDSSYGRIICRCEGVTEGEILSAIRSNPRPTDLDGVKRRTRAQMGRCQGGFCMPYITELLAREMGVSPEEITKSGKGSEVITGRTKEGKKVTDLVIIGGGPAGMSAAVAAYDKGIRDIVILERDDELGGILNQCIHNGFGLHRFKEELTGPEYASRYADMVRERGIEYKTGTMVIDVSPQKVVTATSREDGIFQIEAKAIILAMGCRERPKGALNIPGTRPAGVYSAGTAEKLVNIMGYMPGKNVVILGSGDIGLIMARRMTLEGAKVHAVCELMPYSGGLARNIEQCLNDFDIPLKLSHTVVELHGKKRLEAVTIAKVDENRKPIKGTEEYIPCDTLLLSVGLIPENELTSCAGIELNPITSGAYTDQNRQTMVDGIFACGNVLHVHDLVDFVSEEAALAGEGAASYILGNTGADKCLVDIETDGKIRYCVPSKITEKKDVRIYFRVDNVYRNGIIKVYADGKEVYSKKKQKLAPGEMESITLKKECYASTNKLTLNLEVEQND